MGRNFIDIWSDYIRYETNLTIEMDVFIIIKCVYMTSAVFYIVLMMNGLI